ncbi:MAG: formylglycine-generating enzyme family protein [Candidatus Eremiobacteraeota bacterium]|nr:formylglycine-generating enzyme family protein [Candidatus Eremiobacteraeota bacterium]
MEKINPADGAGLILIPAGEFLMGSPPGEGRNDERPQHKVHLESYGLYKYQVTNGQFAKFAAESGYKAEGVWKTWHKAGRENHPVVCVTWNDALAYSKWAGGSLPTEAQWEKAARGTDGRPFPWGDEWDEARCNWDKGPKLPVMVDLSEGMGTAPVGSFPAGASPCGVHDMLGNVWEWCADWYDKSYYKHSPHENPAGPPEGAHRVLRGGSWAAEEDINPLEDLRCTARRRFNPGYRYRIDFGFRVCLPADTL